MGSIRHEQFMRRALWLAERAAGQTAPNPMVGAVVVKKGRLLAEGYHARAGETHAEVCALRKLSRRQTAGATLYVTLEPCAHQGRTPPCTQAILASGIRRVVVGMRDPHPLVAGRGIRQLRAHGVKVITGILEKECRELNRFYLHRLSHGRPYIIVKSALTLDGKIATAQGDSQWITNKAARDYGHALRASVDAIIVGAETVRRDNPRLTTRRRGKQPRIVVLTRRGISLRGRRLGRRLARVAGRRLAGVTEPPVWVAKKIPLSRLLRRLAREGVQSCLVEGGGGVASSFFRAGLVEEVVACIAPKILGGRAKDWLPGFAARSLRAARPLSGVQFIPVGDNMIVRGRYVHRNH